MDTAQLHLGCSGFVLSDHQAGAGKRPNEAGRQQIASTGPLEFQDSGLVSKRSACLSGLPVLLIEYRNREPGSALVFAGADRGLYSETAAQGYYSLYPKQNRFAGLNGVAGSRLRRCSKPECSAEAFQQLFPEFRAPEQGSFNLVQGLDVAAGLTGLARGPQAKQESGMERSRLNFKGSAGNSIFPQRIPDIGCAVLGESRKMHQAKE